MDGPGERTAEEARGVEAGEAAISTAAIIVVALNASALTLGGRTERTGREGGALKAREGPGAVIVGTSGTGSRGEGEPDMEEKEQRDPPHALSLS